MSKTVKTRIQLKHDTEANWNLATGFIPLAGEMIIYDADAEHSYERFKIGDGTTAVTVLPFADENKADLVHEHEDYALKNEATTTVTDDGEGNVVLTNVAVEEGAIVEEVDPTVPAWAKQPNPPSTTKMNTIAVNLSNTDWSDNSQTINVEGVTANNVVIVSPEVGSQEAYSDAGISCSAQGEGTLTFTCDTTPTTAITVNLVILTS